MALAAEVVLENMNGENYDRIRAKKSIGCILSFRKL